MNQSLLSINVQMIENRILISDFKHDFEAMRFCPSLSFGMYVYTLNKLCKAYLKKYTLNGKMFGCFCAECRIRNIKVTMLLAVNCVIVRSLRRSSLLVWSHAHTTSSFLA